MRRFLIFAITGIVAVGLGCSRTMEPSVSRKPQRKIDWQDPLSVMRGFLSAKKWGDWRTAYRCCDYEETLSKEERAKIKKTWKQKCKGWPVQYMNTYWEISASGYEDDAAVVTIHVLRRDPITRGLQSGETYQEKLKRYKGSWKITSSLPPESSG